MQSELKSNSYLKRESNQIDTNEEFAKLDALLADLLSEVEQPILLNQENKETNWNQYGKVGLTNNRCEISRNLDDIERSVDYLNEQKEKLRSKKSMHFPRTGNKDVIFEEEDQDSSYNLPFRTIKSKFDFYVSNSNDQNLENKNKESCLNKHSFLCTNSNSIDKLHTSQATSKNNDNLLIDASLKTIKPPTSPNNSFSFKHTNLPNTQYNTMKNEIDDDFECSSIKSGFSVASTVQRSKYHTISNNYVESTGPQFSGRQAKRAFSAPPTDMGKIILQRIELKSPLTINNSSTVWYHPNNEASVNFNGSNNALNQNRAIINRYNNRNVLKANTLQPQPQRGTRAISEKPHPVTAGYDTDTGILGYNPRDRIYRQNINMRNLNDFDSDNESLQFRKNSQTLSKRIVETSGYDTDTGLLKARRSLNQRLGNLRYDSNIPIQNAEQSGKSSVSKSNSLFKLNNDVNIKPNTNFHANSLILNQQSSFDNQPFNTNLNARNDNMNVLKPSLNTFVDQGIEHAKAVQMSSSNKSAFHSIAPKRTIKSNENIKLNSIGFQEPSETSPPNEATDIVITVNNHVLDNNSTKNIKRAVQSINSKSPYALSANNDIESQKAWKYVYDIQNYWYKPKISREDAINLLKDKQAGTFLIRDSNNFPGAYGLALKVEKLPPNIPIKVNSDQSVELVRHFLIEPTTGGVRIKGCCNEPVFVNLAALVYQHLVTPLALPCRLILPSYDIQKDLTNVQDLTQSKTDLKLHTTDLSNSNHLLEKGAACHVYYLNTTNVDNMTAFSAINKAIESLNYTKIKDNSQLILIQFKVNTQGVFITDINRKKFVRNHFPTDAVLFCAIDERLWPNKIGKIEQPRIFGLVCKSIDKKQNECHLFVEIDPEQPAIAIVDFINRYLIPSKVNNLSNAL